MSVTAFTIVVTAAKLAVVVYCVVSLVLLVKIYKRISK